MSFDEDFLARAADRLDPPHSDSEDIPHGDAGAWDAPESAERPLTPAAVLVPVIRRPDGFTVLFTQRTANMPTHAGQISFPGGRRQAGDESLVATALRETFEETGVEARHINPIGRIGAYRTVTNFRVAPIVALVEPGFSLNPDPREVADVFEAPLAFLMDDANHQRHDSEWQGRARSYYAMPWQGRNIWGATAGMIRALQARLYAEARDVG